MNTNRHAIRRGVLFPLFVVLSGLALMPATAEAATTNWTNNSGGSFTTAANWDNGVPDAADIAVFDRGSGITYNVTFARGVRADITNDRLVVGSNTVTFNPLGIPAANYILDNTTTIEADPILQMPVRGITIGAQVNDTAAVLISHLALLQAAAATLGHDVRSHGTLTLDQNNDLFNLTGGSTADAELIIGRSGTGVLNVSAGADVTVNGVTGGMFSLPAGNVILGRNSGGHGTANIGGSGSTLDTNTSLIVGDLGTGTLNVTTGGRVEDLTGLVGNLAGSTGAANISGNGSTWSNALLFVGEFGHGTLNITGGGVVDSQFATLAGQSSSMSTATVSGAGSTWNNIGGTFHIGLRGKGTLGITDAGRVNSDDSYIGDLAGSQGSVAVSGAGSLWANTTELYVGNAGTGSLNITAGGQVTSRISTYIAYDENATGKVTVDGAGSSWTAAPSNIWVGAGGDGTLEITGGGQVTAGGGLSGIGGETGSHGEARVDGAGSTWTNDHTLVIGSAGDGTLDITNAGHAINRNGVIGQFTGSTGAVLVDGAGSLWTVNRDLYVGVMGQGTLTAQNGGMVEVEGNVSINASSTATLGAAGVTGNFANSGQLNLRLDCMDPAPEPLPPMDPAIDISGDLINDGTIDVRFDCMDEPLPPGVPPMDPLRTIAVGRGITNNGTFNIANADEQNATIQLGAGHSFTNNVSGVVNLLGPADANEDGTIAAKHIVGGNVVNHGEKNIRTNAQIAGSLTVTVNADLIIDAGEPCCNMTVEVAGPVSNSGSFTMRTNSAAPISDMTLELGPGQTFTNNATGVVNLNGPDDVGGAQEIESKNIVGGDVVNHGEMNIRTNAQIAGALTNTVDADLIIDRGEPCCSMTVEVAGPVSNSGLFTMKTSSAAPISDLTLELGSSETFTNNATGVLQGTGTINGNVLNRGQVRPGNSSGVLAVSGDFMQEADGTLVVEVGGTIPGSQHDQLAIGGEIVLGGLVEVVFAEGFLPQPGNRFDVVTTTESVSGKFVGAALPGLPEGMDWNIDYGTSLVSLVTTIPGDYNADGNVDTADYIVWRKTLGQSVVLGLGADGDASGSIDAADYAIWRANFGATAALARSGATGSASAAIPEPASLGLLLLAAVIGAHCRPRRRVSLIEDSPWRKLATASAAARRIHISIHLSGERAIT